MLLRLFLVASMITVWFAVTPSTGSACSCADPGTPSEALADSALVFRGTVTSISSADDEGMLRVEFDVATVWKGADAPTITVTTHEQSPACGYPFEEQIEYVVYSWDGVDVNLCSRTAPVEFAGEDLAAFSGGAQTGPEVDFPNTGSGGLSAEEPQQDRLAALLAVAGAGALMLGFAGVRLYVRRQTNVDKAANVDQT